MKVIVKFTLSVYQKEIDLTEFGYEENQRWDDLTEDEQNEILDPMRMENIPNVSIEEIED